MKNITMALLQAQRKIKNAPKDAKNPHFKNDYATLESVIHATKDIANECGLVIVQGNGADEFGQFVSTEVLHAETGEKIVSYCYLVLDKQNMQGLGSAITYARRYGLASMFCITQADDDGNSSVHQDVKPDGTPYVFPKNPSKIVVGPDEGDPNAITPYLIPFGKYAKKRLHEIDMKDLGNYVEWLESNSVKTGKPLGDTQLDFINRASEYIGQHENHTNESIPLPDEDEMSQMFPDPLAPMRR